MDAATVGSMWAAYKNGPLIETIHPDDSMFAKGKDWYWSVGESMVQMIAGSLLLAPTKKVRRILDFGCGYGRCSRHLRAFFPGAELVFCELNPEAAAFCAQSFDGRAVDLHDLPADLDMIWVGSVFTHLDVGRVKSIFDELATRLARAGILIVTTHGRMALHKSQTYPYISGRLWTEIVEEYRSSGAGYRSYGREDLGDYGVSLNAASNIIALGENRPDLRLITYCEAGWANHQDVAAWTRYPIS